MTKNAKCAKNAKYYQKLLEITQNENKLPKMPDMTKNDENGQR